MKQPEKSPFQAAVGCRLTERFLHQPLESAGAGATAAVQLVEPQGDPVRRREAFSNRAIDGVLKTARGEGGGEIYEGPGRARYWDRVDEPAVELRKRFGPAFRDDGWILSAAGVRRSGACTSGSLPTPTCSRPPRPTAARADPRRAWLQGTAGRSIRARPAAGKPLGERGSTPLGAPGGRHRRTSIRSSKLERG